jgi:hypothetical protein
MDGGEWGQTPYAQRGIATGVYQSLSILDRGHMGHENGIYAYLEYPQNF